MAGGILQLVANSGAPQNVWLDGDPQITFFKRIYRRTTPFAIEQVPVQFKSPVDFGSSASVEIPPAGDLAHRIFFVFDIPKLAAMFMNSKSQDLCNIINKTTFTDELFMQNLRNLATSSQEIEYDRIFSLIKNTLENYDNEENKRINIAKILENYQDPIGINGILDGIIKNNSNYRLDDEVNHEQTTSQNNNTSYDFDKLKMDLADQWIGHKKEYFLLYELLKLIYLSEKDVTLNTPLTEINKLSNTLLYSNIFNDLVPNREISLMYHLNNNGANFNKTNYFKDHKLFDTYGILKNDDPQNLTKYQELFYNYGPGFHYNLNTYNTIINVVKNLAKTVPIIVAKSFMIKDSNYSIYKDDIPIQIDETSQLPTIIDPNFKSNFMLSVNNLEKPIEDNIFLPIDYTDTYEQLYPNLTQNSYLQLFNNQANKMFNNIRKSIDTLFEKYRTRLFNSTDKLFFNNSPSLSNIYAYSVPTENFKDNENLRIKNVFNANIWFFYFFKYLDYLDEKIFCQFVQDKIITDLSDNGCTFLRYLLILLKINIEYYMNEISYLLNDLYASSPSVYPSDSMKNYVPIAHSTKINNIDIHNNLLGVTIIFHRNHVPTIMEMFQYIYHFISNTTVDKINNNLGTDLEEIELAEIAKIKEIVKLLYYNIFKYFMDTYDSFQFEAPANFTMDEYNVKENNLIMQYVLYFLLGKQNIGQQYKQYTLSKTLSQMEFYFVAEMINMRELQKFYHDILFNEEYILEKVGQTTSDMISMIKKTFIEIDNNFSIDANIFRKINNKDTTRKYFDILYQHNAQNGMEDTLYYSTFNTNRFNGDAYIHTSYLSRNFGQVPKTPNELPLSPPIPLPPTDPYGINPLYYEHNQAVTNFTPLPTNNDNVLKMNIPVYWITNFDNNINTQNNNNTFQLFEIDYFRIRHEIFYNNYLILPDDIDFVDEFQFNLLKLINLNKRLQEVYPIYDKYLLYWIWISLFFLIKHTNPNLVAQLKAMNTYFSYVEESINQSKLLLPKNLITDMTNLLEQIFDKFNNNEKIELYNQSEPYKANDLLDNNNFMYNEINKISGQHINIIDKLTLMRNNFLSQYFYLTKNINGINKLNNILSSNNNTNFNNISQSAVHILNAINDSDLDLSMLDNIAPIVFLYPDMFPKEISQIVGIYNTVNDFDQYIMKQIITFLDPSKISKLTAKDILDIVNITFTSTKEIYQYCMNNDQYDYINEKLSKYHPLLLNKLSLFSEIYAYIKNLPRSKYIDQNDMDYIAQLAESYGIDYDNYLNYLTTNIMPDYNDSVNKNNSIERILLFYVKLNNDLDYFFLNNNNNNEDINSVLLTQSGYTDCPSLFKQAIMQDIFTPSYKKEHPNFEQYFKYIDNQYYAYIYFFMDYVKNNNLSSNLIKNPLISFNQSKLLLDHNNIENHYNSFNHVSDFIKYLMDYIWDYSMTLCGSEPSNTQNLLGYENRFSIHINKNHKLTQQKLQNKIDEDNTNKIAIEHVVSDDNRVRSIISALNEATTANTFAKLLENIQTNTTQNENTYYYDNLDERNRIIELMKDVAHKGIIVLMQQKNEIINFRNKIRNILYRNKKAKTAWIRKLAHFVVKNATLKCGDQIANHHISDWFESYHEISKREGIEPGYMKMIGHREDLIIFDDKIKNSYTIIMPFIFYFNKYIMSSIPLNASINTKYQIDIQLRNLDEVTYKEEFSDFVDPNDLNNLQPYTPKMINPHLMIEYVYLSTEERKIFVTNRLEYLIDEVQYDNTFNISDSNLVPIYKIGTVKKTRTKIKNKTKIREEYYDTNKGVYATANELQNTNYYTDLIPRSDYVPGLYTDRTGITKTMMVFKPLPNINPYIHKKRIELENYFNHPTKLMVILIKPLIHTNPQYRSDDNNYFYGERQWDNYGLYSYYDLSKINEAKQNYYDLFNTRINDLDDPVFGFINIINQLLFQYTNKHEKINENRIEKWIHTNFEYFLEILQTIKDAYNNYYEEIYYRSDMIKLKEFLLAMGINYDITNKDILFQLIDDVHDIIGISKPQEVSIISAFTKIIKEFNLDNMNITKNNFISGITELLSPVLKNFVIRNLDLTNAISDVYSKYNESVVNFLINSINENIDLNGVSEDYHVLLTYFYNIYKAKENPDTNIINAITLIKNKLSDTTSNKIKITKNLTFRDVIQQILNKPNTSLKQIYIDLIPDDVINIISTKMIQTINEIVNDYPVEIINYQKYMVSNPKINPLLSGYLKFNSYNIMPENSMSVMWSEAQAFQYLKHTPSVGINLHSWSLDPLSVQPQGAANLTKIDKFMSVYDVHPLISNTYPALIVSMVLSINIMRYLSGMCGKAWELQS
ncbi:capsid protein [Tupanvirus soda lake]|uniref:Capsid protein n=2 Tax=Tupanvirus TaxID=2094720 RepID=A0A6N1NV73_9VIRU|nr:capsid protein [Tupanvirus soda lake]QKU35376.1 capsid protein [Tupanvirus soda lake]